MVVSGSKRILKRSKGSISKTVEPEAPAPHAPIEDSSLEGNSSRGTQRSEEPNSSNDVQMQAKEDVHEGEEEKQTGLPGGGSTGATLFHSSAEFEVLRQDYEYELNGLRAKASSDVVASRMAELEQRRLTPALIEAALIFRRDQAYAHALEVAAELHLPSEQVSSETEVRRIHDNVLQLFRVLHRRRVAVLRGEKLPRENSVFSKVKLAEE